MRRALTLRIPCLELREDKLRERPEPESLPEPEGEVLPEGEAAEVGEAPAPASTEPERAEPPAGPAASTWQLTSLWDSFFGAPPSDPSESRDETIDDARGPAEDDSGAAVADEVQDENLPEMLVTY